MIATLIVCITAIIITVLIINFKKAKIASDDYFVRIDARLNELSHKIDSVDIHDLKKDYKEIKENSAKINEQIAQVNSKLMMSTVKSRV